MIVAYYAEKLFLFTVLDAHWNRLYTIVGAIKQNASEAVHSKSLTLIV